MNVADGQITEEIKKPQRKNSTVAVSYFENFFLVHDRLWNLVTNRFDGFEIRKDILQFFIV